MLVKVGMVAEVEIDAVGRCCRNIRCIRIPEQARRLETQRVGTADGEVMGIEYVDKSGPRGDGLRCQLLQVIVGKLSCARNEIRARIVATVDDAVLRDDRGEDLGAWPSCFCSLCCSDVARNRVIPRAATIVRIKLGVCARPVIGFIIQVEEHGCAARAVVDLEKVHELVLGNRIQGCRAAGKTQGLTLAWVPRQRINDVGGQGAAAARACVVRAKSRV